MDKYRKTLKMSILVLGLLFVAGLVRGLFFAMIFWSYLFVCVAGVITFIAVGAKKDWALISILAAKSSAQKWPKRMLSGLGDAVASVTACLNWPAQLLLLGISSRAAAHRRGRSIRTLPGQLSFVVQALEVEPFYRSVILAMMTTLWYLLLESIPLTSKYAPRLMYFALLAVIFEHVLSFWTPGGIVNGFKKQAGSPLLKFVAVGFCDVIVLILSLTIIVTRPRQPFDTTALITSAKQLFTLHAAVTQAISDGPATAVKYVHSLSARQSLFVVAGCLMYFVLVRTASNGFAQFKRTDEDYYTVAKTLTVKGDFEGALKQLDNTPDTIKSQELRILPLLAVKKVKKAGQCVWWMLEFDHTIDRPDFSNEDIYFELFAKAMLLGSEQRFEVWYEAVCARTAQSFLMIMLIMIKGDEKTRELILEQGSMPHLDMAFATADLFEGRTRESLNAWFSEDVPGLSEDAFAHSCLRLLASTHFIKTKQEARDLFEAQAQTEGERMSQAAEMMLLKAPWTQALLLMISAEMFEMASQAKSPRADSWKDLRDRSIVALGKSRKEPGVGDFLRKLVDGKEQLKGSIHPAPAS